MSVELTRAFAEIGAELELESRGRGVEIDVRRRDGREVFLLRQPSFGEVLAEAVDVRPRHRHLVLDVYGDRLPSSGRFLCGHDEQHWFVAAVPFGRRTESVRGAMEALKPEIVRREQKRKGVAHRRHRRRTEAYIRQGEWFFLPRPQMHVDVSLVQANGRLARKGGKPHRVEWLYEMDETLKFARGRVSHPDHSTLQLDVWHRVVQNAEPAAAPRPRAAAPFVRMAYVD